MFKAQGCDLQALLFSHLLLPLPRSVKGWGEGWSTMPLSGPPRQSSAHSHPHQVDNSIFSGNQAAANATIASCDRTSTGGGGAACVMVQGGVGIINCTFTGNTATDGGERPRIRSGLGRPARRQGAYRESVKMW